MAMVRMTGSPAGGRSVFDGSRFDIALSPKCARRPGHLAGENILSRDVRR
jgi:hypothetical protein